jgi:60 kDa SS-A/Ro ribonucleoprotein
MDNYSKMVQNKKTLTATPITEPIAGKTMIQNSSGVYVFQVSDWMHLKRFLVLGASGPSFYATQNDIVKESHDTIVKLIKSNGVQVLDECYRTSINNLAPKQEPLLFTLALIATYGDEAAKNALKANFNKMVRTGTFLLKFVNFMNSLRGWGRFPKSLISNWFNSQDAKNLAYQVTKYNNRDGWRMFDVLRLAHPMPPTDSHKILYSYLKNGWNEIGDEPHSDPNLHIVWAKEKAAKTTDEKEIAKLVSDYGLTWEMLDNKWLSSHVVWDAIFETIKPEALMRHLARLTSNGYLTNSNNATKKIVDIFSNADTIKRARLHPLKILTALKIYSQGHGDKGSLTWSPIPKITDILDEAHYLSYNFVEPTNQSYSLFLDISGSMSSARIAGSPLTAREASAALAMLIAKTEKDHTFAGFSDKVIPLNISPKQRMDDVLKTISNLNFGSTDISAAFDYALAESKKRGNSPSKNIVVLTDNEVNVSRIHPIQAFDKYKKATGVDAKLIVVGTSVDKFTVADPSRSDNLDVVGFSPEVPEVIRNFVVGE